MDDNLGIIFLDGDEVILRVYHLHTSHTWKLLMQQCYDLATGVPEKKPNSSAFIEAIAGALFNYYEGIIVDWKIYARNVADEILHDVAAASGFPSEMLTLKREQDLLCDGALVEIGN